MGGTGGLSRAALDLAIALGLVGIVSLAGWAAYTVWRTLTIRALRRRAGLDLVDRHAAARAALARRHAIAASRAAHPSTPRLRGWWPEGDLDDWPRP
jgi:hypothetical protein